MSSALIKNWLRALSIVGLVVAAMLVGPQAAPAAAAGYPVCNTTIHILNGPTVPSRGNNPGTVMCVIARGAVSDAVWALQVALRCEVPGLPVDGIFGPKTEAAVRTAQRNARIKVDGIYGPQTRNYMKWPSSRGCMTFSWAD